MSDKPNDDVGAVGRTLKIAMAHEAVRQGELQMAAQVNHLQAAETRAISLLGWTNAAALAGAALAASHNFQFAIWIIILVASPALITILSCIAALWPSRWIGQGTDINWLLDSVLDSDSELSNLTLMAKGYADAIKENEARIWKITGLIRIGYFGFSLSAAFGIAIALYFTSSSQHPFWWQLFYHHSS